MRTISKWAHLNPIKSRFMIAGLYLLSIANAILLGIQFFLGDWPSSTVPTIFLTIIIFIAFLLYPKVRGRLTSQKYRRQKLCDFTLVFSSVLFLAFSVNNYLAAPSGNHLGLSQATPSTVQMAAIGQANDTEVAAPPTKAEVRKARKSQFRELKTSIRAWKQAHKGNKKGSDVREILLILLVILGAAVAAVGLAVLTCSLACSGSGGLAVLLMIAGVTGIVFLSVVLIKNIVGANGPPARPVRHG